MKQAETGHKEDARKFHLLLDALPRIYPPLSRLLMRSFLSGLFSALGATIGLSLVIGIITYLLKSLGLLPQLTGYLGKIGK